MCIPNQKWVWIMESDLNMSDEILNMILERASGKGYSVRDVHRVPQKW